MGEWMDTTNHQTIAQPPPPPLPSPFMSIIAKMQCCVFSRSFPHRRTPHGEFVETYEHLIAYLLAKPCVGSGGVRRHFLPFLGRNQVLFSLPEPVVAEAVEIAGKDA
jgi:hypothetical protein